MAHRFLIVVAGMLAFIGCEPSSGTDRDYRKQIKTALIMLGELVGWDRLVQLIGAGEICQFKEDGPALRSSSTVRACLPSLGRGNLVRLHRA